jgi:hypothetical protein
MSRWLFSSQNIVFLTILLFVSACNLGVPHVTPTVAPTDTPTEGATQVVQQATRTPIITLTGTSTLTQTLTTTPLPTVTPAPTLTANPSETPTLTLTPSETFTATVTPSSTLTVTPSPTVTPAPTNTPNPSETSTLTFTPSQTATATVTASSTLTITPSFTPTLTATTTATITATPPPTLTDLPRPATETPTFTPSPSPSWTATPSQTATPSDTPTATETLMPTIDLTERNENVRATGTTFFATELAKNMSSTPTVPPPTINATPRYITAVPGATVTLDLNIIVPPTGQAEVEQFVDTATPTIAPTVAIISVPATVARPSIIVPPSYGISANFSSWSFDIDPNSSLIGVDGSLAVGRGLDLIPGLNTTLFARSPTNPNNYALTNPVGTLFTRSATGANRPSTYPFISEEFYSLLDNNLYVREIAWAPNGQRFAFIIDGDLHTQGRPLDDDGVYYMDWGSNTSHKLLHDCPDEAHRCYFGGSIETYFQSVTLEWSPQSDMLLVTVDLPEWRAASGERKGGLFFVSTGQSPDSQPPSALYDYGSWTVDGQRVVVSGYTWDGRTIISTVNRQGQGEQLIFNAGAAGWWVQNAVQRSNGQIIALGRPGNRHGAMQIINQAGTPLTGFIGYAEPYRVRWSPDRSAVLVSTIDGRHYVAHVNGSIQDITGDVGNSPVDWVNGPLPPVRMGGGGGSVPSSYIPSGVIEGSRYYSGQQLRINYGSLNLRSAPSQYNTPVGVVTYGEWVAILAGPVNAEGVEWWYIQNAAGLTGWIAGKIGGVDTLR